MTFFSLKIILLVDHLQVKTFLNPNNNNNPNNSLFHLPDFHDEASD